MMIYEENKLRSEIELEINEYVHTLSNMEYIDLMDALVKIIGNKFDNPELLK